MIHYVVKSFRGNPIRSLFATTASSKRNGDIKQSDFIYPNWLSANDCTLILRAVMLQHTFQCISNE